MSDVRVIITSSEYEYVILSSGRKSVPNKHFNFDVNIEQLTVFSSSSLEAEVVYIILVTIKRNAIDFVDE